MAETCSEQSAPPLLMVASLRDGQSRRTPEPVLPRGISPGRYVPNDDRARAAAFCERFADYFLVFN